MNLLLRFAPGRFRRKPVVNPKNLAHLPVGVALISFLCLLVPLAPRTQARQQPGRGQQMEKTKPPAAASARLDYDESHALIIGISHYLNGWRDLPGVLTDVKEVRSALEKHGFQVAVKLDLKQADLDQAIRQFVGAHGQKPKNRLIIYFAGHGHTLMTNYGSPLGYLVPADAPLPKDDNPGPFKSLAVSMSDIEKFAREIESKHALFVFDSCFSGSLFRVRSSAIPDSISDLTDQQVRQFITAGTEKQSVPDESVFRKQFVRALGGEADLDQDGFVTGMELGYFLRKSVTDYTRKLQTPEYGKIRDPDLDKGDFVFVSPKGANLTAKPQPLPPPPSYETTKSQTVETSPPADSGRWVVAADESISVAAQTDWTETGMQIKSGQEITIKGGNVQLNLGAIGYAGASGTTKADARKPMSNCPTGALLAKLNNQMFCVKSEYKFTAASAGTLWLGVNESNCADNIGAWTVSVLVNEFRRQ
jgi:hypothetical protein